MSFNSPKGKKKNYLTGIYEKYNINLEINLINGIEWMNI